MAMERRVCQKPTPNAHPHLPSLKSKPLLAGSGWVEGRGERETGRRFLVVSVVFNFAVAIFHSWKTGADFVCGIRLRETLGSPEQDPRKNEKEIWPHRPRAMTRL